MNRLSIANLLSSPPVMQVTNDWQSMDRREFLFFIFELHKTINYISEFNDSLIPQLLQNPFAINFWLQFQNAQLQPHLQYAALARSLVAENPLDLRNKVWWSVTKKWHTN